MTRAAGKLRVAFQGAHGAFSEEAAIRLLGRRITCVPRPTFESLFDAIEEGAADLLLAPLENSLAGSVQRSYDLLLESSLHIVGEVVIPIRHHLIGVPGASLEQIRIVQSHPVALAQCEKFFRAHPRIRRVAAEDTAESVREIVAAGDPARAAIASAHAAAVYGGVILARGLEDHRENYTRFVLLAASPTPARGANKLSLVLRLAHRPGALWRALGPFARRGVNLLKIESRPIPGRPWQYHFYLDLRGSLAQPRVRAALQDLKKIAAALRVLGCYRAAALPYSRKKGAER